MARRKLLAVPEDQLMLCTSTHGPPSNSLQLTQASAAADSTSSSLLQQSSSLQAGSCSHQASNASPHQSAELRSPSLASVVSELLPNQTAKATNSSQRVAAPPNSVCVPPAVLHAPRAIPAALANARSGSAPPHVIQLGPIFQPMLAAMQTNPVFLARAPAEAPNQALHPAQASRGPVTPTLAANEQLQHMLHAAQAIGYCQGLKRRAAQTDELQKLSFHRRAVTPSSSADQAGRPTGPSQPQQAQPDPTSHHTHHQMAVASDAQTASQDDARPPVAQPCPEEAFSRGVVAQQHLGVGKSDPYRETGSLDSRTLGHSLSGNKRAHEASDAHKHTSSKKQRLVEVAQQCGTPVSGHDDSKVIKFRCNIADILDAHAGPFSQVSSSARAGSTSVRAGPSRASPTVPSVSFPDAAGTNCFPAMSAASSLGSASINTLTSPHQSQDMARRAALLPQPATAQSVAGAVAAAQGTDWALAAHAAALRSSWQSFLPHVRPQPSIANQLQGPPPPGDQAGVPFQPMLTSFPQVMNQLMSESRADSVPSWVADHQAAAPMAHLGGSGGQRHGQEDDPPYKRLRQGADSQLAAAAAAPSLHSLPNRQLPQLTSIQLLKHRARQHMANAGAAPLGSSLPSSFQIPSAASTAQLASSQHASAVNQLAPFNRASSAEAHGPGREIGFARSNSDSVFTSAQTVLPQHRSALAQLSALSIDASAQIDLTDGIKEQGSGIMYRANVREILTEGEGDKLKAVGVQLADDSVFHGQTVISNATRWDTFKYLMEQQALPKSEQLCRKRYKNNPSFIFTHMGVKADVLPQGAQCHHIIVEIWQKMQDPHETLLVSVPSLLDPSVCPKGPHGVHIFTPDWADNWKGMTTQQYEQKKKEAANALVERPKAFFPGLQEATLFMEVGSPTTHRKFLNRADGSYGPIPSRRPLGMLGMPFNRTAVKGLYCVGDSTFPGQGVNAVVFSGFGCVHRVLCDLGKQPTIPILDPVYNGLLRESDVRDRA